MMPQKVSSVLCSSHERKKKRRHSKEIEKQNLCHSMP
uniref:Uncharacterized protein n=1 Tax=Arundo donax TaxID=35708 RepID=A0A0A8YSM2_ARUDO